MKLSKHPPAARLTLRVGVSGHRGIKPAQIERIKSDLGAVFAVLDGVIDELAKTYSDYFSPPAALKRLVSPLAEGADSLAAEIAKAHGYAIQAPLPFSREEYARDFEDGRKQELEAHLASADTVFELNGGRDGARSEEAAYLASGYLTLRQCDVLIAIWDGKAARGIGGTAMVVEAAVQRGVPVIWVHSEEATALCLLRDDLLFGAPLAEMRGILWQTLAPPFLPSESASDDSFAAKGRRSVKEFCLETQRRQNFGFAFQLFQSLIAWHKPPKLLFRHKAYEDSTSENWRSFDETIGAQNRFAWTRISEILAPRFSWADGLANHYAEIYRSSYVLNYLLGALAVLLALVGLLFGAKQIWVSLEVLVIFSILGVTSTGRRKRWHERWIDYRQLAEQLRHLRFLYLTGGTSASMTPRHHYDSGRAEGGWVQWYYQSTMRELGLAPASATPAYLDAVKGLFLEEEITGQIRYHERNAHRMHKVEHSLHKLGDVLFLTTLIVCLSYLVFMMVAEVHHMELMVRVKELLKEPVTFVTALLPALGAAMSGIRVQGEFASTAERSEAMATRLTQLQNEIEADTKLEEAGLARLRSLIETTSETMLIEVVDWRFVFRGKPLSLPA